MNPPQLEKEFILRCLRELVNSKSPGLMREPRLLQKLDWDWIIDSCNTQRILGFVSFILKKRNVLRELDDKVRQTLHEGQRQSEMKNRLRQRQFQQVSEVLNKKRIAVIPLKGAALTYLIYNELPFREMFDVDILVREKDCNEALKLLCGEGFRRRDEYVSKNRWHTRISSEIISPERIPIGRIPLERENLQLDLHFNPRYRIEQKYVGMDVANVWERAVLFPQLGPNVYMLSQSDQLAYLLLHAVEFFSPRLVQVLDIALITERYSPGTDHFFDRMYVDLPPSSRLCIEAFNKTIKELFRAEADTLAFSTETSELLDKFFSRTRIPNVMPEGFSTPPGPIIGAQALKNIGSFRKQALFIAGYFLPSPEYYRGQGTVVSYFRHWRALISKAFSLLFHHKAVKGKGNKPNA